MKLCPEIQALLDDCIQIRRSLHQIPELGFELPETQNYVFHSLETCKPDRLEKLAIAGVKAVFYGKSAVRTVAFRADMDALNEREPEGKPVCSRNPGMMHGCGHDGHMTILLLLAKYIASVRDRLQCNVVLLFQPGEEGWEGAERMVEENALENPAVDVIYGLHLWPTVPKGKIGVRWGPAMAMTSDFSITVYGKSAHASTPQLGIDAVVVAAELITMLQTVITRSVDPHQDALLTLGKIEGGTAHNIIADKVTLTGTLRVFHPSLYKTIRTKAQALMNGLETATGAKFTLNHLAEYPSVENPRNLVESMYARLDSMDDVVLVEPVMAAEDFAVYQQQVPGLFVFLGIQGGRGGAALHSPEFDFDEDALLTGVELFRRLIDLA